MQTPEGKIKDKIRQTLRSAGCRLFSPVQMGIGAPALDLIGCSPHNGGRYFEIEVKRERSEPTARQKQVIAEVKRAEGISFWCDSHESFLVNAGLYGILPPSTK